MEEVWKDVVDWEGKYAVSNLGRLAVIRKGEYIGKRISKSANGYLCVFLSDKPKRPQTVNMSLHSIVARAFHGERPKGMIIRHIDGNRFNNRADNLCYGFPEENWADTVKHGCHKGSRHGNSKLDERDVKIIKSLLNEAVSQSVIARAFDVTPQAIHSISTGKGWSHID